MNSARILKSFFVSLVLLSASATVSAADVGVSVNIGQPDFFGRINIGDYPQPRLIYDRPVIIDRIVGVSEPLYLRVPPGHYKNWKSNCGRYQACGRQVYFVQDNWYRNEYVPAYQKRHGKQGYKNDNDHDGHGHDNHGGKHNGNGKNKGGKGKD